MDPIDSEDVTPVLGRCWLDDRKDMSFAHKNARFSFRKNRPIAQKLKVVVVVVVVE